MKYKKKILKIIIKNIFKFEKNALILSYLLFYNLQKFEPVTKVNLSNTVLLFCYFDDKNDLLRRNRTNNLSNLEALNLIKIQGFMSTIGHEYYMKVVIADLLFTHYIDDNIYFIFKTLKYPTFSKNNLSKILLKLNVKKVLRKEKYFYVYSTPQRFLAIMNEDTKTISISKFSESWFGI